MDFRLSDDQVTLVDGVRQFFAGTHGPEVLRDLDGLDSKRSSTIASALVDMGLPGLLVPESQGGLGLGLIDAVLIAVECGRTALAEPLVDTAFIAVPILVRAGGHEALLASIVGGEARIALSHPCNPWISDLETANRVLSADGDTLVLADVGTATPLTSIDPLRKLAAPQKPDGASIDAPASALFDTAALLHAALVLGVAKAMLQISTDYAMVREQFGQPIGGFQAIKHQLANAAVAIEFVAPVLYRAAQSMDENSPLAPVLISHAKIAATDAALSTAETAIQIHGAMGYTYEVDLHFWMKRAWSLAGAWGDRAFHLARVEDAIIGGSLPIGPSETFA